MVNPVAGEAQLHEPLSKRIAPLDGIRGFAIVLVLIAHTVHTRTGDTLGSFAVSLFFVLSGYLITSLLVRERAKTGRIDLRAFFGRRVRRIFPAYYVYLAAITIATLIGWTDTDWRILGLDALYLRNYAFGLPPDWWTGHAWTLCIEEQFYFVWPVVLVAGGLKWGWRFAMTCLVAAPILRVATYLAFPHARDFVDVMLPTRIDMLMYGCALAMFAAERPERIAAVSVRTGTVTLLALLAVSAIGIALAVRFGGLYQFTIGYTIIGFTCATIVFYVVKYPMTLLGRALSLSWVTWLGRISYSLYLWQQPFLTPDLNHTIFGRFPFGLITAILIAIASYYFIERRFFVAKPVVAPA